MTQISEGGILNAAVKETNFNFKGQTGFYRGKVRDVYDFGGKVVMIASDRISAFDVVLPRPIPFKGQVLNQIAAKFLNATKDIVPNWVLSNFAPEELPMLEQIIKISLDATTIITKDGATEAQNKFNNTDLRPKPEPKLNPELKTQ